MRITFDPKNRTWTDPDGWIVLPQWLVDAHDNVVVMANGQNHFVSQITRRLGLVVVHLVETDQVGPLESLQNLD